MTRSFHVRPWFCCPPSGAKGMLLSSTLSSFLTYLCPSPTLPRELFTEPLQSVQLPRLYSRLFLMIPLFSFNFFSYFFPIRPIVSVCCFLLSGGYPTLSILFLVTLQSDRNPSQKADLVNSPSYFLRSCWSWGFHFFFPRMLMPGLHTPPSFFLFRISPLQSISAASF